MGSLQTDMVQVVKTVSGGTVNLTVQCVSGVIDIRVYATFVLLPVYRVQRTAHSAQRTVHSVQCTVFGAVQLLSAFM